MTTNKTAERERNEAKMTVMFKQRKGEKLRARAGEKNFKWEHTRVLKFK